ncbi:MAG: MATE family efflux transporter [Myxococcota bacterium]|nr:MATE family efflux transporter [Myxococcota bacterium]
MHELRALLRLTGPLLITQLGNMLLGVVDTAVVGRLGEVPLGAVGLGNAVFFTLSVLGFGWMLALDPLIAQAVGAGEKRRARHLLWQGVWVAAGGAVPLTLLVVLVTENVGRFGVPPETVREVTPYLYARLIGLAPFLVLAASRAFLQAREVTRPLVIGVILANVLNLPLTWGLVFGELGLPRLGTAGAGWASAFATCVQLAVALLAVTKLWGPHRRFHPPALAPIRKVLKLGTPIGLQLAAEVGSFAIVTVLMSRLGTLALGAHNVALTLISTTFQVAVALGAATAVRVGHAVGRSDAPGTRRSGLTGIAAGAGAMLAGAALFLTVPAHLARVITDEAEVIAAAVPLFAVAAAFQISDGVQAVAAGALRGAGDTRWPLVANLVGHYAIGVPLGATLAFTLEMGAVGLWWGLSAGLTAVAIGLTARFAWLSRRPIARA